MTSGQAELSDGLCGVVCGDEPRWACARHRDHTGRHESEDGGDWYDDTACAECGRHYGDGGPCDQGKPVASPHRAPEVRRGGLYCTHSSALYCYDCGQLVNQPPPEASNG